MKGLRTYLRQCRKLTAQGKLREADAIFQLVEDGLDQDHNLKQAKKDRNRAPHPPTHSSYTTWRNNRPDRD